MKDVIELGDWIAAFYADWHTVRDEKAIAKRRLGVSLSEVYLPFDSAHEGGSIQRMSYARIVQVLCSALISLVALLPLRCSQIKKTLFFFYHYRRYNLCGFLPQHILLFLSIVIRMILFHVPVHVLAFLEMVQTYITKIHLAFRSSILVTSIKFDNGCLTAWAFLDRLYGSVFVSIDVYLPSCFFKIYTSQPLMIGRLAVRADRAGAPFAVLKPYDICAEDDIALSGRALEKSSPFSLEVSL